MLGGFWLLRGCGGGGLSEYVNICDENVAVAILEIFKHLKNLKYNVKTESIVRKGIPGPPSLTQQFAPAF